LFGSGLELAFEVTNYFPHSMQYKIHPGGDTSILSKNETKTLYSKEYGM
jgi:hypothetical protein